jgi:hypothetical protein
MKPSGSLLQRCRVLPRVGEPVKRFYRLPDRDVQEKGRAINITFVWQGWLRYEARRGSGERINLLDL